MEIVMARTLFSASRLEIIDLSYNKLRSTLGFPCLVTLKRINLSHNRLSGVLGLETLPNLTHLDVSVRYASGSGGGGLLVSMTPPFLLFLLFPLPQYNSLQSLFTFRDLSALEELDVSCNYITEVRRCCLAPSPTAWLHHPYYRSFLAAAAKFNGNFQSQSAGGAPQPHWLH